MTQNMIMSSSPPSFLKNDIKTNINFPFIQKQQDISNIANTAGGLWFLCITQNNLDRHRENQLNLKIAESVSLRNE